ncbi:hypothetical protein F7230_08460 [Corynebacterium sp. 320]|uniref:Membrane protein YkvI n=1 Tax=Corynebacterium zhongnanshanii TaxID=2768834 RepID=A0ABQ6VD62_9CORY|nr:MULTISPECIES: hypothetical protein [Corynebacterium]KAB1502458.1 hypothetical protein F7230_08460 [Corynebacterium sp. 320]KAB1551321.1 hypothetical protein F7233_07320 [Corynebacterium sp. 321]KAB1551851.1 hypothetical protein F7232_06950 [Corynebacterium sp. 319]KAB3520860.1 hypothetical protein F8377_06350 [Corynebacterium zhongnanshanii]KAB3526065.1 hypothetical protein F8354_08460 [Corynebacterium sp. 250]
MAFVGLTVGAGFATGKEVIQYFMSFGLVGLWGVAIAGLVVTISGAVFLQIGSYFLADEHNMVFKKTSHPIVSRFLDISVTLTLFCIGFVMLAGAGSNLEQQFDLPAWIGALIMTVIVILTGMLDVDKVSRVIGGLTPLIIIAVIFAFVYTMMNMPDTSTAEALAQAEESPVSPWWLSALNYDGLALLLGVSMTLVIGGNYASPRQAGMGGIIGGAIYTIMLFISAITLYLNMEDVQGTSVPMLEIINQIHPTLGIIMAFIIFVMIFNTAIGMFYALARRVTASTKFSFRPALIGATLVGYAVSFVGFESLMAKVYPVIGYVGLLMIAALVAWWIKSRARIARESKRRDRIHELTTHREDPEEDFSAKEERELDKHLSESHIDEEQLAEVIDGEVKDKLDD